MRVRIRRSTKCIAVFLSLLGVLVLFSDSPLFSRLHKRQIAETGLQGKLPNLVLPEADFVKQRQVSGNIGDRFVQNDEPKEADDVQERLRADPQQQLHTDGDVNPQQDVQVQHPENVGNVTYGEGRKGPENEASDVEVEDWSRIRAQYFREETLPDDMLALKPPRYLSNYKNPCFYVLDPQGDIQLGEGVRVRLKCLPYFHLIGVDKSGTTDLWFRLTHHQQVVKNSGVLGKETHWWSWRRFGFDIWIRNAPIRHFDWFISHFDAAAKVMADTTETRDNVTFHPLITGEGSPTVFWDFTGWDRIPQNKGKTAETALVTPHCIHHLTPQAKLILILRNPVDRLYSEYIFLDRFKGHHNISASLFHDGVMHSIDMFKDCVDLHGSFPCLYNKTLHMALPVRIMVGMYVVWLKQWLNVFPREQILIMRSEDYGEHLETHLGKVFDFLELSRLTETEMQKIVSQQRALQRRQSDKAVGDMLPETRRTLTDFFHPFNKLLVDLLADDAYLWF